MHEPESPTGCNTPQGSASVVAGYHDHQYHKYVLLLRFACESCMQKLHAKVACKSCHHLPRLN
ncbi:unnamed protein product [Ixodes persulcatus]